MENILFWSIFSTKQVNYPSHKKLQVFDLWLTPIFLFFIKSSQFWIEIVEIY